MSDKIASLYRSRVAKEKGVVRKDWGGRISIALTYPNHYRVGMSNLGFQVVYHLLNRKDNVVAERVFLPEDQEMALYPETGKGLLSLESLSPLNRFDLIAFSLSFENDYPNVLKILQMGKIPLLSEERDETLPFVMAGGVTTFLNPEPIAFFFDFFLLGDAEATLDQFLELFADIRSTASSRREVLRTLARNGKSVYVPSFYHVEYHKDGTIRSREPTEDHIPERVEVACQSRPDTPPATTAVLTPDTEFSDKVLVELGKGCTRSCRFCAAGYVYRPPWVQDKSALLSTIDKVMDRSHHIGLLSASISDIPWIEDITGMIIEKGGDFSISSLRADSLSKGLLDHLIKVGQRTLTIAPEAGSERLRKVVNKHLTQEQIMETVKLIAQTGNFNLRLYFLIGLPTETRDDVTDILDLVKTMKHHIVKESRSRGRIRQIRLSVNCFVPKPVTPFQWFPMEDISTLKEKQKWLKKALGKEGGVRVSFDLPKWAYLQSMLSLGDRRVGSILLEACKLNWDWRKTFRYSELNPDFFVYRPRGLEEVLPWDFVDNGIFKEYLVKEYKLALRGEESDICQVGECERCGACRPQ